MEAKPRLTSVLEWGSGLDKIQNSNQFSAKCTQPHSGLCSPEWGWAKRKTTS